MLGFLEAVDAGLFHVERPGAGVGPVQLYPLQRQFGAAVWDARTPDGRRPYRRAVFSMPKKAGKSTFSAVQALFHLLFDHVEPDREIYSLAGDMDQACITLNLGKRIVQRSPGLQNLNIKAYARELVYIDDEGAEHRWKALASDSPTGHGLNPSLVVIDEGWQFTNYDLLEAISLGPQRLSPMQLWCTYAGLRGSMMPGQPLYDLYQAGMEHSDSALYFCWRSGLQAYEELPEGFIRPGYLDEQRRMLPANRFARLHLNEWASRDVGFITDEELRTATTLKAPVVTTSRDVHVLAVDYGRSNDHTALVAVRRGADGAVTVSDARVFQGTKESPVPLELVETNVAQMVRALNVHRLLIDPYQMLGSAERLAKRLGWPMLDTAGAEKHQQRKAIVMRPIGAQYLNRMTMGLLSLFRSPGAIQIPAALTDLIAQLGSVISVETFYGTRIDSGRGAGVRGHDDLVVALGMAALELTGRTVLVEMPHYNCRISNADWSVCELSGGGARKWEYHSTCQLCEGLKFVKAGALAHQMPLNEFLDTKVKRYMHSAVLDIRIGNLML